jgi:rhamnogalacturonyl hydrolase YesR
VSVTIAEFTRTNCRLTTMIDHAPMSGTENTGIQHALRELYRWATVQDFAGHDPHDLLTSPVLRGWKNPLARLVAVQLGRRSPINLHTLLRVPHAENPKALALFVMGLLQARDAVSPNWKEDAAKLGERLLASQHENGGWGYAFPWQSRTHFLPAHTPNIVTTSFAGSALIELYEQNPSQKWLDATQSAANYIISLKTESPAFGYAKNDPQIVFNASLLGAEFLLKAGTLLSNSEYTRLARRFTAFVVDHQRTDGGWDYGLEKSQHWTDSFHTGFVIVSLKHMADIFGDTQLAEAAQRGFEYYKKTFLQPDFTIRYFPPKRYPIDAHALGQAMVTFEVFGDHETALRIAEWSLENMRSPEGYFYYQHHRLFTNRVPYLRWANAWMFFGLSSLEQR